MKFWWLLITCMALRRCVLALEPLGQTISRRQPEILQHHEAETISKPNRQFTKEQLAIIERNRKVAQILTDVDKEFETRRARRKNKGSEDFKNTEYLPFFSKARKSYYLLKHKWSRFQYGYGKNKIEITLPKYLQDLENLVLSSGAETSTLEENVPLMAAIPEKHQHLRNFDDEDDCESFDDENYEDYDDDDWENCDKNMIKKLIKKICKRLDEKQKEALKTFAHILHGINHGSVEAIHALALCLSEIEEELFEIFKEILIIIDKLVEIGIDAVKLVLEVIIEIIGGILRSYEERKCGCECPDFIHSILKYLIDIITWTPQKLLHQLISHIIDIFTSLPWFRCTCACEGIYALNYDETSSQTIPLIYAVWSNTSFSYKNNSTLSTGDFQKRENEEIETGTVAIEGFTKKQSKKLSSRRGEVKIPILDKVDSKLAKKIENRKEKESKKQSYQNDLYDNLEFEEFDDYDDFYQDDYYSDQLTENRKEKHFSESKYKPKKQKEYYEDDGFYEKEIEDTPNRSLRKMRNGRKERHENPHKESTNRRGSQKSFDDDRSIKYDNSPRRKNGAFRQKGTPTKKLLTKLYDN